jgi:hypothetical protein
VPADKLMQYLTTYEWADPATYANHLGPAPVLLRELQDAISEFIAVHNQNPKSFVWTKKADQILASIARFASSTLAAHGPQKPSPPRLTTWLPAVRCPPVGSPVGCAVNVRRRWHRGSPKNAFLQCQSLRGN